ncbi:nuclear transport factor 2 family protein [Rhizobium sp. AN80A]|uniref:nuclear transport factor 2 family protein n=1 Tax=Rhizobium sp. AN80A TaxID=3040673 RepID=UPI0024B32A61|nr:nuclear transport factor 2 family protein [Rhizobium sp. AN80A]
MIEDPIIETEKVKSLSHRYAVALDTGNDAMWRDLFCDEMILTSGAAPPRSLGEVLRMPAVQLARYSKTQHLVSTQLVELNGNSATGTVYCTAHHFLNVSHIGDRYQSGACHTFQIVYDDSYLRIDGVWKFSRRQVDVIARSIWPTQN